jgi:hypothetical protein
VAATTYFCRRTQPPPNHSLDLGSDRKVVWARTPAIGSCNVQPVDRTCDALMANDVYEQAVVRVTADSHPDPLTAPQNDSSPVVCNLHGLSLATGASSG